MKIESFQDFDRDEVRVRVTAKIDPRTIVYVPPQSLMGASLSRSFPIVWRVPKDRDDE